ncbi:MAG: cytochrome ubiquinol oxidase subunit I [Myxococcales bacterium]
MPEALTVDRWQFAFTITFHYLFPQLTMGLSLLLVLFEGLGLRRPAFREAGRFWGRIFALAFAMGVVTGIPMEFQFGTNWSAFSRYAGQVVGQPLAMEGLYSFFLESSLLGLYLFGGARLGRLGRFCTALAVCAGSWLSGFFILATDAFLQHPTGQAPGPDGTLQLASLGDLLGNPWLGWQYAHNMSASVITASFAVAAVGAFYLLSGRFEAHGRRFVAAGVLAGLAASLFQIFPSGDSQGRNVARWQPPTLAAMEGLFHSRAGAPLEIIGQPDMEKLQLDNPIEVPRALSFLTYRRWGAEIRGLDAFPREAWPANVPLVYFGYHIMVGLGTLFVLLLALAAVQLARGRLFEQRPILWALLLAAPFPYVATTAGWLTAELGRQPWLVYGLYRTAQGTSPHVSSGSAVFSLLGFCGIDLVLGLLFLALVGRAIARGPEGQAAH